jgi:predicted MFS family arabinose efflux permease
MSARKNNTALGDAIPLMSWVALILMLGAYTFSWIDRYLLVILVDPIEKDLGLTDAQMGLLTGFAFSLIYSLAGFPLARMADRGSRRNILAIATGLWSLMTLVTGFVRGFAGLVLARASIAVCEAGCSPASHSLISDYFPPRRRSMAFSIYVLGISFGIWLGLAAGGLISDRYGWRMAFVVLGAPGIALAVIIRLVLRDPQRGRFDIGHEANRSYKLNEALGVFWQRRSFLAAILGLALLSFSSSALEIWAPVWLMRARDASAGQIGSIFGGIEGIAGTLGTLIAGYLADRCGARDPRWYIWVLVIAVVLVVPAEILFLYTGQSGNPFWVYTWLSLVVVGMSTYTAPMFALGQLLMPPRLKALGAATLLFALNMIGSGAGPSIAGGLSDLLTPSFGADALKYAMLLCMLTLIPGLACLGYAIVRLPHDLARADGTEKS